MWQILREYGVMFLVGGWPQGPLGGFAATLILSAGGLAISFPLAVCLGLARTSKRRALLWPATVWVYAFRGVPLIMIIFWAYFVLPALTGAGVSAFATALCAIVLYESAFLGEIVRAGLEALPRGQTEAASAVGLTYAQSMRYVILPQALANMIPSLVNQFVSTIKATSIVYVIGVQEVTFAAQQVNSMETAYALQTFLVLAAMYFVPCFALSRLAGRMERGLTHKRLGAA